MMPDPVALCREALDYARNRPRVSGPFLSALACIEGRDPASAAEELASIPETELFLVATYIDLWWHQWGGERANLEPFREKICERLAVERGSWATSVGWPWVRVWAREVGWQLPAEQVKVLSGYFTSSVLGLTAAAAAKNGDADAAEAFAERIDETDREERSTAYAHAAIAAPYSPRYRHRLETALGVPTNRLIDSGYEETMALGNVIALLADSGVPADDAAIETACQKLRTLRDGSAGLREMSRGLCKAAVHAARRAKSCNDTVWLDLAKQWKDWVWDRLYRIQALAEVAAACQALAQSDQARELVDEIEDDRLGGPRLAALFRAKLLDNPELLTEYFEHRSLRELAFAAFRVGAAPKEIVGLLTQGVSPYQRQTADIVSFLRSVEHPVPQTMIDELAESQMTCEVIPVIGFAQRLGRTEKVRELLAQTPIDERCNSLEQLAEILNPEDLAEIETYLVNPSEKKSARRRTNFLANLASIHWKAGRYEDAERCIETALIPTDVDDSFEWPAPSEAKSSNSDRDQRARMYQTPPLEPLPPLDQPFDEALQEIVDQFKHRGNDSLADLSDLGRRVIDDPAALARVCSAIATIGLDENEHNFESWKVMRACRVAHLRILAGEVDLALEIGVRQPDCRINGWGAWLIALWASEWMAARPEEFTRERAVDLIRILLGLRYSEFGRPTLEVGSRIVRHARPEDRRKLQALFLKLRETLTLERDHSVLFAAVAIGQAESHEQDNARKTIRQAVQHLDDGRTCSFLAPLVVEAVIRVAQAIELPDREQLLHAAMLSLQDRESWQDAMIQLFAVGDQTTVPDVIEQGEHTNEFREVLRGIWLATAAELAPRPVEAVLRLFDPKPPNGDRAKRQAKRLAIALDREGRDQEAVQVRTMAGL
jgi:tetratricopeptide (TPR) repeat protein